MRRVALLVIAVLALLPATAAAQDETAIVKRLTHMRAAGPYSGRIRDRRRATTGRMRFPWNDGRRASWRRTPSSSPRPPRWRLRDRRHAAAPRCSAPASSTGAASAREPLPARGRRPACSAACRSVAEVLRPAARTSRTSRRRSRTWASARSGDGCAVTSRGRSAARWSRLRRRCVEVGGAAERAAYNRGLFTDGRGDQATCRSRGGEARRGTGERGDRGALKPGAGEQRAEALDCPRRWSRRRWARRSESRRRTLDNWFAETLLKLAPAPGGRDRYRPRAASDRGRARWRSGGTCRSRGRLEARRRNNRASPQSIVRLLDRDVRQRRLRPVRGLAPIAGEDGALYDRMRRGPATSTAAGSSTLSN